MEESKEILEIKHTTTRFYNASHCCCRQTEQSVGDEQRIRFPFAINGLKPIHSRAAKAQSLD